MAYWTGLVLAVIAAGLLVNGWRRRQAVRAERVALGYAPDDDTPQRGNPYSSIAILGDSVPPIIIAALGFVGVKAVFFYAVLGGGMFTIVDLAGFLMLLGGYGAWMWWHSKYRFAETAGSAPAEQAPAEAAVATAAPDERTPGLAARGDGEPGPATGDSPETAPDRRHVA